MIIRARTVLCPARPPLEDGAVLVAGRRIRATGPWREIVRLPHRDVVDLQDAVLLPGLVNAHCHLDYSDMAGQLPPPKSFLDWIPQIMSAKADWGPAQYAQSWANGARMLLESGTTTVADIEAIPDLLPAAWNATPLRVHSFLEMTGIRARRDPADILREAEAKIDSLAGQRNLAGLSPHAPYSTRPELLRLSARLARERHWRVCMHVAESAEEFDMFRHAHGRMHEWMQRNERDNTDCGLGSPVRHLERNHLLNESLLAVHVNMLDRGDASLLGRRRVNVVHCPQSHDYFGHPPFQRQGLARAGTNLCLGTDSLASTRKNGRRTPTLNMFDEMRTLARNDPTVSPKEILRMATLNGAHALGLAEKVGELTPNAFADLLAIPYSGTPGGAHEAVVHHAGPVTALMIEGKWVQPPKV